MADVENTTIYDAALKAYKYVDASVAGINGRGKKRDGTTKSVGGKTVVVGQDVTNQVEHTKDL